MPEIDPPQEQTLPSSEEALDQLRAELLALDARSLLPVNINVATAALVALGALPEIQPYRAELLESFGEAKMRSLDRLDLVARAALQAHAERIAISSPTDLQPLADQLIRFRDLFATEVRLLILREALEPHVLRDLTMHNGHSNLCVDVLQLVVLLRKEWDLVGPKTQVSEQELKRADGLANQLLTAVGARELPPRTNGDIRARAYTLLATTYNDVRRMIAYLRWNDGDADRIAPALHNSRFCRRRKKVVEQPTITEGPTTLAPITSASVRPGMPGAPPFTEG